VLDGINAEAIDIGVGDPVFIGFTQMAQGSRHLVIIGRTVAVIDVLEVKEISFPEFGVIENLGLKPRRFTAALLLNMSIVYEIYAKM
jgi:hypothetical protein